MMSGINPIRTGVLDKRVSRGGGGVTLRIYSFVWKRRAFKFGTQSKM